MTDISLYAIRRFIIIYIFIIFNIYISKNANIQRNPFSKLYSKPLIIQELKFNTKNINEAAQQEALLKYKQNVHDIIFRRNY